jgi:hypothetical protein
VTRLSTSGEKLRVHSTRRANHNGRWQY